MILVDAGVLIDFLRTKDPKLDHLFRSRQAAICGATRSEVLAGSRSAQLGIENDLEVWARDPHFSAMQKILPKLKLFAEPP
jgi:predicted nucleic acid-binding protein